MARRALQPGELGNITTTKVSKQGKAWVVNQDNGTHWRASVLVGRRGNTPKRIRTIATSKRQAVKQCEEQAKQYIDDAKRASGAITPQSTPMEVWDAYAQSQRHQALAPATRRNYETAIADSQHENPHWWHLPLDEAITVSALTARTRTRPCPNGRPTGYAPKPATPHTQPPARACSIAHKQPCAESVASSSTKSANQACQSTASAKP